MVMSFLTVTQLCVAVIPLVSPRGNWTMLVELFAIVNDLSVSLLLHVLC